MIYGPHFHGFVTRGKQFFLVDLGDPEKSGNLY
jgi:hypothetical protein